VLATSLVHGFSNDFRAVFAVHRHLTEIRTDEQGSQHNGIIAIVDVVFDQDHPPCEFQIGGKKVQYRLFILQKM